jgi:hypothetical protein
MNLSTFLETEFKPNVFRTELNYCKSNSKLSYDRRSFGQSVLLLGHICEPRQNFHSLPWKLVLELCFFLMWRPLWPDDTSVNYHCCWNSPAQSMLGLSPTEPMTLHCCFNFETAWTLRARSLYLFPHEQGNPVYPRHRVCFMQYVFWDPFSPTPLHHIMACQVLRLQRQFSHLSSCTPHRRCQLLNSYLPN